MPKIQPHYDAIILAQAEPGLNVALPFAGQPRPQDNCYVTMPMSRERKFADLPAADAAISPILACDRIAICREQTFREIGPEAAIQPVIF